MKVCQLSSLVQHVMVQAGPRISIFLLGDYGGKLHGHVAGFMIHSASIDSISSSIMS